MAESQSPSGDQDCYQLHEVVWAKITGFPWWPARVTALPSSANPHYRVDFFADTTQYCSPHSAPSCRTASSPPTNPCAAIRPCCARSRRPSGGQSPPPTNSSSASSPHASSPRPPELKPGQPYKNNYRTRPTLNQLAYKRPSQQGRKATARKRLVSCCGGTTCTPSRNWSCRAGGERGAAGKVSGGIR